MMKVKDKKFYEDKEKGVNVCILRLGNGKIFKGVSVCKEEDMKYYSSILGGFLAESIAYKKYYSFLIKYYTKLPNVVASQEFLKDKEKKIAEATIGYDQVCAAMKNEVEEYFKAKERVKKYLERKEKGLPLTMAEDLQNKAKKIREIAGKKK